MTACSFFSPLIQRCNVISFSSSLGSLSEYKSESLSQRESPFSVITPLVTYIELLCIYYAIMLLRKKAYFSVPFIFSSFWQILTVVLRLNEEVNFSSAKANGNTQDSELKNASNFLDITKLRELFRFKVSQE